VSELRWILLGAGVALILGLWWWETRRTQPTVDPTETWPRGRAEPSVDTEGGTSREIPVAPRSPQPKSERLRAPRRPPLVEISDDLEVDISAYVGKDRRRLPEPGPIEMSGPGTARATTGTGDRSSRYEPDADHRESWVSTQPQLQSDAAPHRAARADEPNLTESVDEQTSEAARQRIVALRLVAPEERWNGRQLREAIEAEGLHYGRYSIFHREREDGKTIFYIASMMEPGSFDLARMDGQLFPGISLFGIVPGPLDAPATFDMVLAVARHLAERLKGQLQDEQGSTLTAQRILNLREELVHFEHRNKRLRRN
jgi:cell division protein ZipA